MSVLTTAYGGWPFDLVLLLVLSNAVQNSMNGGDNSLIGGLVSAATLVALNYGIGHATFKSKRLEATIPASDLMIDLVGVN